MKDDRGLYYHPYPQNRNLRVYVRKPVNEIEFRMWNAADPELWEKHGWVPYDAIRQAAAVYSGSRFDARTVYDIAVAKELIASEGTE
jgi:hypothetical protein